MEFNGFERNSDGLGDIRVVAGRRGVEDIYTELRVQTYRLEGIRGTGRNRNGFEKIGRG